MKIIKTKKIKESKGGFVRKYKGCSIHDAGDVYVCTNEHGLNIGQSKTEAGCEGIIDEYVAHKPVKESKAKSMIDVLGDVKDKNESCKANEKCDVKESVGEEIDKYQEWVDYDMKHYGKVSGKTMSELRKAGLTLVKDNHGDWEVIAKSYDESCDKKSRKKITESEELDREYFASLVKLGDKPYDGYSILNDGYFVKRIYAESDDDAVKQFRAWVDKGGMKNESCSGEKCESRERDIEIRKDRDKTRRLRREIRADKRHLRDDDDYIKGDKKRNKFGDDDISEDEIPLF